MFSTTVVSKLNFKPFVIDRNRAPQGRPSLNTAFNEIQGAWLKCLWAGESQKDGRPPITIQCRDVCTQTLPSLHLHPEMWTWAICRRPLMEMRSDWLKTRRGSAFCLWFWEIFGFSSTFYVWWSLGLLWHKCFCSKQNQILSAGRATSSCSQTCLQTVVVCSRLHNSSQIREDAESW